MAPEGPALSSRRFQPAGNEAEGVAPTPTGLIPQARDPHRGRCTFSLSFRGFHPRLLIVCPSGAIPTVTPVEDLDVSLLSYRTSEISHITQDTHVICQIWALQFAVIPAKARRTEVPKGIPTHTTPAPLQARFRLQPARSHSNILGNIIPWGEL
jgi:hypothetical protein